MKVRKNLEAVFLAAAVFGTFVSGATAQTPAITVITSAAQAAPEAIDGKVQVVEVKARRLTAAEKLALN